MFDWLSDGLDWVGDQVSSIFSSGPQELSDPSYYADTTVNLGQSASGGAFDWLSSNGFKSAMAGGAQALLSRGGNRGGGSGSQFAGRLSSNTAADRLPVSAMGDAKGPRAIVSEEPNTLDAYWSDRMRSFGRLSDTNSATKAK